MRVPGNTIIGNKGLRLVVLAVGFLCTGLAVLGIFLPLLPTVPLLLLAAACFARSSDRFHNWLLTHPQLGPLIRGYIDGQGIPKKAKITAIVLICITISVSVVFFIPYVWLRFLLVFIGISIIIYLLRLPSCH